jgi:hypothetical protein
VKARDFFGLVVPDSVHTKVSKDATAIKRPFEICKTFFTSAFDSDYDSLVGLQTNDITRCNPYA